MANRRHLGILRRGIQEWNDWRKEHPEIQPELDGADLHGDLDEAVLRSGISGVDGYLMGADLSDANLQGADVSGSDLTGADLRRANLTDADLHGSDLSTGADRRDSDLSSGADLRGVRLINANLSHANLSDANLTKAELTNANLNSATLSDADLSNADLTGANLKGVDLADANLTKADLTNADLRLADLRGVQLAGANITKAILGWGVIGLVDLSKCEGLETVEHEGPSDIATSTLERTAAGLAKDGSRRGEIEAFLRGCGLSDWEIQAARLHAPGLSTDELTDITYEIHRLKGEGPIQINPLFISYSHANTAFVEALERRFDKKHIRYWRDVHDMKAGRIETQIDRAIRHNPIVLLVLSKGSVESDWVEWEVSKARELEKKEKRDVLCPVALDDAWKTCRWPGRLRHQIQEYNILDFSKWEDEAIMARQFQKLVDGLGMFYPMDKPPTG